MNREIKFKVWDTHNKLFLNRDQFNVRCDGYNGGIQGNKSAGVVGGAIALQYTGFKDKNEKEIYEGDVLTMITKNSMSDMEVKFVNGCFVGEGPFNTHPLSAYLDSLDFIEWTVTSNIYEK